MMRRTLTLAALLAFAACGTPPSTVSLPADSNSGAGEATRAAIYSSAYIFATPDSVRGNPSQAARAVAQVEYLASEIPGGPRWAAFNPNVGTSLLAARAELRTAFGISPAADPQAVVDGLYGASRALAGNDTAAAALQLPPPVFADARVTLARLGQLPALPQTRWATTMAQQELVRRQSRRQ